MQANSITDMVLYECYLRPKLIMNYYKLEAEKIWDEHVASYPPQKYMYDVSWGNIVLQQWLFRSISVWCMINMEVSEFSKFDYQNHSSIYDDNILSHSLDILTLYFYSVSTEYNMNKILDIFVNQKHDTNNPLKVRSRNLQNSTYQLYFVSVYSSFAFFPRILFSLASTFSASISSSKTMFMQNRYFFLFDSLSKTKQK